MIVDISALGFDGREFAGEDPFDVLELGDAGDVKPAGPIRYDLTISLVGDGFVAQGVLKADFAFECVRCAEFFALTVCEPDFMAVRETLNKDESIDLTQDIRESIILAFPTSPLCAPDCKGLCQRCRTNLNKSACRCERTSTEGGWNVLNNLQLR